MPTSYWSSADSESGPIDWYANEGNTQPDIPAVGVVDYEDVRTEWVNGPKHRAKQRWRDWFLQRSIMLGAVGGAILATLLIFGINMLLGSTPANRPAPGVVTTTVTPEPTPRATVTRREALPGVRPTATVTKRAARPTRTRTVVRKVPGPTTTVTSTHCPIGDTSDGCPEQ